MYYCVVVFQILISLKDAGSHLTYVVCVIPLLLFFGLISAWTFLFVAVYRTPYQVITYIYCVSLCQIYNLFI